MFNFTKTKKSVTDGFLIYGVIKTINIENQEYVLILYFWPLRINTYISKFHTINYNFWELNIHFCDFYLFCVSYNIETPYVTHVYGICTVDCINSSEMERVIHLEFYCAYLTLCVLKASSNHSIETVQCPQLSYNKM